MKSESMKNYGFTIVARNYLPLAQALSWSLKNNNKSKLNFIIFVVDQFEDKHGDCENIDRIIPISELNIMNLDEMLFKYNVTEFCTAIKPSCFKYIFNELKADNVIYFDPDIFIFNDIEPILDDLKLYEIVVTPHFVTPQLHYTGDDEETMMFFVGIFNFGFVAIKKTLNNSFILNWWENRLLDKCFGDRQDALHTDQKWADFWPVYVGSRMLISKAIGYNLAPWNLFEREIIKNDNMFLVRNRFTKNIEPLIFVHFAGYDPNDMSIIHKYSFGLTIERYPEYNLIRDIYNEITSKFNFVELKQSVYSFSKFSNGEFIQDYHRRLYRALIENNRKITNPFDANGDFYKLLVENKLIDKDRPTKYTVKDMKNYEGQKRKVELIFRLLLRIFGVKKYFIFMKFLNRFSRPENQTFLLNISDTKFY
jgi:hypothetical protein